jgi:hypothetical protein
VFVTVNGIRPPQFVRCIFDFAVAALEGVVHSGCAFELSTEPPVCPWPDPTGSGGSRSPGPSASRSPWADGGEETPESGGREAPNTQVKTIVIVVGCVVGVGIAAGLAVFIVRKVAERHAKNPMDELLEP